MVKAIKKKSKKSESSDRIETHIPEVEEREGGGVFDDPTISQTVAEDPLFKFFQRWSNHIFGTVLVVLLVWSVTRMLESTHIAGQMSAAQIYAALRNNVAEINGIDRELTEQQVKLQNLQKEEGDSTTQIAAIEKEMKDLSERRARLVTSGEGKAVALREQKSPYDVIGRMYAVLLSVQNPTVKSLPAEMNKVQWQAVRPDNPERLFLEVGALRLARSYLDQEALRTQGMATLNELADKGVYMHAMAGRTFAEVANNEDEKRTALTILEEILAAHPEQAEVLEDILQQLKNTSEDIE